MDQFPQLNRTDILQNTPESQAQAAGQRLAEESWGEWASEHKLLVGVGIAAGIAVVAVGGYLAYRAISSRLAQNAERELASAASAKLSSVVGGSKPLEGQLLNWAASNLQTPANKALDLAALKLTPSSAVIDGSLAGIQKQGSTLAESSLTKMPSPSAEHAIAPVLAKGSPTLATGKVVDGAYTWGAANPVSRAADPVSRAADPVSRAADPVSRAADPMVRVMDPVSIAAPKGLDEISMNVVAGDSRSMLAQVAAGNTNAANQYVTRPLLDRAVEALKASKAEQRIGELLDPATKVPERLVQHGTGAAGSDFSRWIPQLTGTQNTGTGAGIMDDILKNMGKSTVDKSLSSHIPALSGFELRPSNGLF